MKGRRRGCKDIESDKYVHLLVTNMIFLRNKQKEIYIGKNGKEQTPTHNFRTVHRTDDKKRIANEAATLWLVLSGALITHPVPCTMYSVHLFFDREIARRHVQHCVEQATRWPKVTTATTSGRLKCEMSKLDEKQGQMICLTFDFLGSSDSKIIC